MAYSSTLPPSLTTIEMDAFNSNATIGAHALDIIRVLDSNPYSQNTALWPTVSLNKRRQSHRRSPSRSVENPRTSNNHSVLMDPRAVYVEALRQEQEHAIREFPGWDRRPRQESIINELPDELLSRIFHLVDWHDRLRAERVCMRWRRVVRANG